ncbi:DUF3747 domain-containing protein [Pleurocapsa sp. FMAR1]|uniref:DUF3747 domain-containing protein n=1 Tax=Pleurocapsa sp. FMAR1 TaxID=3040204 RepID=UPI0029C7FB24|nr:DUF3747 domain-containing protein [Pleurocapsa sp. FMAR1]
MKLSKKLKLAAVFLSAIALTSPLPAALAQFTSTPIPAEQVVAVAVPAGQVGYSLTIVQQIPGKKQCFAEKGSQPTIIDPLWTTFDFTNSCLRSTDSNGYSVSLDGQDNGLDYRLDVVPKGNELQLVANSYQDRSKLVVGQTFGKPPKGEYAKIQLNPGWELTKKVYQGKVLGSFLLSGDSQAIAAAGGTIPQPSANFSDIANDIYKKEIEQAVALGFIAGYKDKTFRPTESLTREQLVSMAYGALGTVKSVQLASLPSVPTQPYADVDSSRWSAAKIQWAKENDVVKGYPDGSFKPEQPVTRAELVVVLQNLAKFANTKEGKPAELKPTQQPKAFSDTANHWASQNIQTMSAYCGVASAYQEMGNAFQPDTPAARDYAAAATLRTQECLTGGKPKGEMNMKEGMQDNMKEGEMNMQEGAQDNMKEGEMNMQEGAQDNMKEGEMNMQEGAQDNMKKEKMNMNK